MRHKKEDKGDISFMKSDMEDNKKPWFSKVNILTIIALSVSLSFTVFFFSPVDLFLGNQQEFILSAGAVILPMLAVSAIASLVLIIAGMISLIHKYLYTFFTSILFGLLLAFYSQLLLFNGDMQLMTGNEAIYSEATTSNVVNLIVVYIIAMLPLILTLAREIESIGKKFAFTKGKTAAYVSVLIFVMQFFGSASMLAQNGLLNNDDSMAYLSYESALSLSENENITVFLLDMLDGECMDESLMLYPELNDMLEGFTYYRNNVSRYGQTFPSIVCMLTDSEYTASAGKLGFLDSSWNGDTLPKRLAENNFNVNLVIGRVDDFSTYSSLAGCSNLKYSSSGYKINYTGPDGVVEVMMDLSFAKLSPYILKYVFLTNVKEDFMDGFLTIEDDSPDRLPLMVTTASDIKFYNYFTEYGLNTNSDKKTFSFIHLCGAHNDSYEISSYYPEFSGIEDRYTTVRGEFEIVSAWFDQMKELGVYEDSTIIIIADHGITGGALSSASLLIKPSGAENIPLKTDSNAELSNSNFFAGILDYAGIDHSGYGYSYNDIINGGLTQDRYFTSGLTEDMVTYRISGDARDVSNWEIVPSYN